MCLVPDGDLFEALSSGRASVVTDRIETFTENGLRLESGDELEADLVVTATGPEHDRCWAAWSSRSTAARSSSSKTLSYKGLMLSGVPNMAFSIGYTNASWTLKCDLTCDYVCRLLNHMDERGYAPVRGRVQRSLGRRGADHRLLLGLRAARSRSASRSRGRSGPWRLYQNYPLDLRDLRYGPIEDGALRFSAPAAAVDGVDRVAA